MVPFHCVENIAIVDHLFDIYDSDWFSILDLFGQCENFFVQYPDYGRLHLLQGLLTVLHLQSFTVILF